MKVDGCHYRTIWIDPEDTACVRVIDQRELPHNLRIKRIQSVEEMVRAIADMTVRGAPLIGVAAAFGMYLAALEAPENNLHAFMYKCAKLLRDSRPTAINLDWSVNLQLQVLETLARMRSSKLSIKEVRTELLSNAQHIADDDVAMCKNIGEAGIEIIRRISQRKHGEPINILTHCNAGWLACVDWGTATSAIYHAFDEGISVHVWVDETRPRNQGASLTAWELGKHGVPYTLVSDNAGGYLMQTGKVDLVLVGADRVTRRGDAANKIGTYLKALAAHANNVPFYVAIPSSTIDWDTEFGSDIPIEERSANEVKYVTGVCDGVTRSVLICPADASAANYAFDVTPAHLITGLITECGVTDSSEEGLHSLFPQQIREVAH